MRSFSQLQAWLLPQQYTLLNEKRPTTSRAVLYLTRFLLYVFALLALVNVVLYVSSTDDESSSSRRKGGSPSKLSEWFSRKEQWHIDSVAPTVLEKPKDYRIIGLVFYGRIDRMSILDCYLKRNLVENGGWLDEIIFVVRTGNPVDLAFLDEILATSTSYSRNDDGMNAGYGKAWEIPKNGSMYIKIDDDVLYIEDTAIPSMVTTLAAHPEYLTVSANMINNPALSWVHSRLGAVRPYLPELANPSPPSTPVSWRASLLPTWDGDVENFDYTPAFGAPAENHRWLPLPPGIPDDNTPISITTYDKAGPGWYSWAVAAQQHYSFLENLERDELWRYKFGVWDYHYDRLSIQMLAVWGKDVVENQPVASDDEAFWTMDLPRKLKRHTVVTGNGIGVHYHFGAQGGNEQPNGWHGIEWTDILERYRSYAKENICVSPYPGEHLFESAPLAKAKRGRMVGR